MPTTIRLSTFHDTVRALEQLRTRDQLPDHFIRRGASKQAGDFDVHEYFTVFKHLSMQSGYVLDYAYQIVRGAGHPLLYARKSEDKPDRLLVHEFEEPMREILLSNPPLWLNYIETDGTPTGFLELDVMSSLAGQFYLYWHSNYDDTVAVCHVDALETILGQLWERQREIAALKTVASKEKNGEDRPLWTDAKDRAARALDFTPTVELLDDGARVRWIGFTKWGGFKENTSQWTRMFPHRRVDGESRVLVEYECGIIF